MEKVNKVVARIEVQYFPPIAYFSSLVGKHEAIIERHEHYEKQTYRNRCYLLNSQGKEALTVPVTSKHGKALITDVRIDYSQKWLNVHWRAIQSSYGKAPFFEFYADEVHQLLFTKHERLYDLNLEVLTMCLKWMKWPLIIRESESYDKALKDSVIDLRSAITPKKDDLVRKFYQPAVYHQVFGSKFVENLSLLDLILCEGPGARKVVQASTPK